MGEVIVAVDIGSSKVCTVISQVVKAGSVQILGKGIDNCSGVKKGIIIDIDATSKSIRHSIEQAEALANLKVVSAFVNISATHADIIKNRNLIVLGAENREITTKDVEKLLYSSMEIPLSEDREIVDVIPDQYIVDGCEEIIDPIGMTGTRLEADVNIIAGKITSVQNIIKSMERADIKVDGLIVEGFSTSEILLTPEEKDMGTIMLDIGGSTTDISVFKNKNIIHYGSIPVGGDHITNDIAIGLKIPTSEAERIKRHYELALTSLIKNDQDITVSDLNDNRKKNVRVSELVEIIEARVFEIFSLAREQIDKSGISNAKYSEIVLTGAGISYIDGNIQLAGEVFQKPVRVANIRMGETFKCEFFVSAGMTKYVSCHNRGKNAGNVVKPLRPKQTDEKEGFFKRLSRFFHSLF